MESLIIILLILAMILIWVCGYIISNDLKIIKENIQAQGDATRATIWIENSKLETSEMEICFMEFPFMSSVNEYDWSDKRIISIERMTKPNGNPNGYRVYYFGDKD